MSFKRPNWMYWHLKKVDITGAQGDIKYEINKYIPFNEGDQVSSTDTESVQKLIVAGLTQLEYVKVHRNYFNKHLKVSVKRKPALAKITEGTMLYYIAPNATLFKDELLPQYQTLLHITADAKITDDILSQELVKLFKDLNAAKNIKIKEVQLSLKQGAYKLLLQDGTVADMGTYDNGAAKADNLAQVLNMAAAKGFKAPHNINFKYFNDGKVYLKN